MIYSLKSRTLTRHPDRRVFLRKSMFLYFWRWFYARVLTAPTRWTSIKQPIHHGLLAVVFVGYTTTFVQVTDGAPLSTCLDYAIEAIAGQITPKRRHIIMTGILAYTYHPQSGCLRIYLSGEALLNLQAQ